MNRTLTICLGAMLLLAAQSAARAQDGERPFNPVAESVANAIKAEFPGWKQVPVAPLNFEGTDTFSNEVIIDQWVSDEANVKVAIMIHPSKEAAKEALKDFAEGVKADEFLQDLGNEACAWGMGKSIAFRKGVYTIYISTVPPGLSADGEIIYSTDRPQELRFNKAFARIVAGALKDSE